MLIKWFTLKVKVVFKIVGIREKMTVCHANTKYVGLKILNVVTLISTAQIIMTMVSSPS